MTDWGVHLLDIVQAGFDEEQPKIVTASGGKWYLTDNRETPDTLKVTYEYPSGWIATYENRNNNGQSLFNKSYGILLFGTNGTMFIDRSEYFILPEMKVETGDEAAVKAKVPLMPESSMKSVSSRQFQPLEELHLLHQIARETHLRYRDVSQEHDDVPAGQCGSSFGRAAGVRCRETNAQQPQAEEMADCANTASHGS